MSLYDDTTNKRLEGRTIVRADVNGFGIILILDNGMRLEYYASDGGYSSWGITQMEGGTK